jgi:hypothetical protein
MEEAMYVVAKQVDFQENIQYFSIDSGDQLGIVCEDPGLYQSSPKLGEPHVSIIHIIIYKNKNENYFLVLLDDSRPPQIVAKRGLD